MKKLKLSRETLRTLQDASLLSQARGGNLTISVCDENACSGDSQFTGGTGGTAITFTGCMTSQK